MENKDIHWYELSFYGDEDPDSGQYDPENACSYVIKTEIPPVIKDDAALRILFGDNPQPWMEDLMANCTCVMEVTEDEAQFFDIEDLTERVESELGTYYTRPGARTR